MDECKPLGDGADGAGGGGAHGGGAPRAGRVPQGAAEPQGLDLRHLQVRAPGRPHQAGAVLSQELFICLLIKLLFYYTFSIMPSLDRELSS